MEVIIQIISHAIIKDNIEAEVIIDSSIVQAGAELCQLQVKLGWPYILTIPVAWDW